MFGQYCENWKTEIRELYCVWAYRCGGLESYNFPVGVFKTFKQAQKAARRHRAFRGGKYDHRIFLLPIGKEFDAEEATLVQDVQPPRK